MRLYIINETDRPYERLVVVREGFKGRYNNLGGPKNYIFENLTEATPLEDFGITSTWLNGGWYCVCDRPSVAVYSDGRPRKWQGASEFIVT